MKKILILLVAFIISTTACFANSSVVIKNSNQKDVLTRIMKSLIKQGSTIENVSDYSFTAFNVDTGFLTHMIYGSNQELRYTFSAIQDRHNVILSVNVKSTIYAGSAANQNIYCYKSQETMLLKAFKKAIEGYYTYGFEAKKIRKGLKIVHIYTEHKEAYDKLSKNDIIICINGQSVKEMSAPEALAKLPVYEPEQKICLKVLNKITQEEREINLKSIYIKPTI